MLPSRDVRGQAGEQDRPEARKPPEVLAMPLRSRSACRTSRNGVDDEVGAGAGARLTTTIGLSGPASALRVTKWSAASGLQRSIRQQHAVNHRQHALDFTTEALCTPCRRDVDVRAFVFNGNKVLGQNRMPRSFFQRSFESMTRSVSAWFSRKVPDFQQLSICVFNASTWAMMATLQGASHGSESLRRGGGLSPPAIRSVSNACFVWHGSVFPAQRRVPEKKA